MIYLLTKNPIYHADVPGKGKDLGECNGKSYFYVDSKVKTRRKKNRFLTIILIFFRAATPQRWQNAAHWECARCPLQLMTNRSASKNTLIVILIFVPRI